MISRRKVLGLSASAAACYCLPALTQGLPKPDYVLDIDYATLDLSPRHRLRTIAYNDQAPGPVLRVTEGRAVTIEVNNRTDRQEVVHWHGLFLPPRIDGALEEGTPGIPARSSTRYSFVPNPAGFRWYHTHSMSMGDFTHGQYSGQHGFLLVDPRENPARYDREFFVALHDWYGYPVTNQDGALSAAYALSTINGKTLGFGEPLRVKQGERVLLHVLNSSPTEVHWLALAGHRFQVIALDGNAVPTPQNVSMLRLAPAERVCALVQMDNPGVWVLGEVRKHVQAAGMGIVVEYAERGKPPRWEQPLDLIWDYDQFADPRARSEPTRPPIIVPLVFESQFRGHGAMEGWLINGKPYPASAIEPLLEGERYRLQFINKSADAHPLHLHRHTFEVRRVGAAIGASDSAPHAITGLKKDVILVDPQTQTDVEFIADKPGATLLHCHQQDHMELGFMMLINYA